MLVKLETSYGSIWVNPNYVVMIRPTESGQGARILMNQEELIVMESPALALKKLKQGVKYTLNE